MAKLIACLVIVLAAVSPGGICRAESQARIDLRQLEGVFGGAERVDLSKSQVSSVVKLREVVKIPPPAEPVLVKVFKRDSLPDVLKPAFVRKGTMGVTIGGRFVAIIQCELRDAQADVLRHELVHAYITMASPSPLPFWFQEASAVHFSTDKGRKFYGQPSEKQLGVTVGAVMDLDPTYKQKLASFHYLIEKVGARRFYEWHRDAVETGVVDAKVLLDPEKADAERKDFRRPIPVWAIVAGGLVVLGVIVAGLYSARRDSGYY